jgi:hypothetical protein
MRRHLVAQPPLGGLADALLFRGAEKRQRYWRRRLQCTVADDVRRRNADVVEQLKQVAHRRKRG